VQETGLPPFDLSALELQVGGIHRSYSNDSSLASTPLGSPTSAGFPDMYAPTSDPMSLPRSVPYNMDNGTVPQTFAQGGIQFPASWQVPTSDLLQLNAPASSSGYMSIMDLAQQIFQDPLPTTVAPSMTPSMAPTSAPISTINRPLQPSPPKIDALSARPPSIDAVMSSTNTPQSPPTSTAASSPMPAHGPKFLYRSNSSHFAPEDRLISLAAEVGMSALLLSQCIKQYFRHIYSIRPFIHEPSFRARLSQPEELSSEEKVLILSLCAVTALHDSPEVDLSLEKRHQLGRHFLDLAVQMRKTFEWIEYSTLSAIQTSYHICVALFELKRPRSHHFYLREAIGMAYDQGLHHESTYFGMEPVQAICARRTFAILFVTERGLAILRNKPATITKLPVVPSEFFDEQDRMVLAGFTALASLFAALDEKFIDLWRSDTTATAPHENIAGIQHSLNDFYVDRSTLTDVQKADVLITHQWLRLIFWQASMRQGLVSTDAIDPVFYYDYPIRIAKDMCQVLAELNYEAIVVHGLGIFEKIFEIAYTLMDALTISKLQWGESEELRVLFQCLAASPNSENTYVRMLETKADAVGSQQSPVTSPGALSNGA
jgi:hypothetical protein